MKEKISLQLINNLLADHEIDKIDRIDVIERGKQHVCRINCGKSRETATRRSKRLVHWIQSAFESLEVSVEIVQNIYSDSSKLNAVWFAEAIIVSNPISVEDYRLHGYHVAPTRRDNVQTCSGKLNDSFVVMVDGDKKVGQLAQYSDRHWVDLLVDWYFIGLFAGQSTEFDRKLAKVLLGVKQPRPNPDLTVSHVEKALSFGDYRSSRHVEVIERGRQIVCRIQHREGSANLKAWRGAKWLSHTVSRLVGVDAKPHVFNDEDSAWAEAIIVTNHISEDDCHAHQYTVRESLEDHNYSWSYYDKYDGSWVIKMSVIEIGRVPTACPIEYTNDLLQLWYGKGLQEALMIEDTMISDQTIFENLGTETL